MIAEGCRIGANAVVCKTCEEENSTLVGIIPARAVESHSGSTLGSGSASS